MYSLYRAWFGSAEESYHQSLRLSPPDTVVRVGQDGEYHFVAHRAVLAAHSGYLKALLASNATGDVAVDAVSANAAASSHDTTATPLITSITVPSSIGGEAFGPLLHYMYTGRLEVTLDNIYTVLLATHLLHMPGALEQCRAALLRLRAPPAVPPNVTTTTATNALSSSSQSNNVLRPVPNRLLGPAFCWPQTANHLYPPRHLELPHLPALQLPTVQLPAPIIHKSTPYGSKEPSVSPVSSISPQATHLSQSGNGRSPSVSPELVVVSSASPQTHLNVDDEDEHSNGARGRRSVSASSERISVSDTGSDHQQLQPTQQRQQQKQSRRNRASQQQQQQQQQQHHHHQKSRQSSRSVRDRSTASSSSLASAAVQTPGVIYDVACCDGPVRFHRVLNENYAPSSDVQPPVIPTQHQSQPQPQQQSPPQQQQQQQQQPQQRVLSPQQCNGRGYRENDENEHRVPPSSQRHSHPITQPLPAIMNNTGDSENRSYTCGYCQHTFKSQNCYRKHARRHLLPTDGSAGGGGAGTGSGAGGGGGSAGSVNEERQTPQANEGKKREVRLLDLNVQYYPCKICGSKFPSYYFVHKHRKLHHANIDEPSTQRNVNDEQKQQQQQPSTSENIQQHQQTA